MATIGRLNTTPNSQHPPAALLAQCPPCEVLYSKDIKFHTVQSQVQLLQAVFGAGAPVIVLGCEPHASDPAGTMVFLAHLTLRPEAGAYRLVDSECMHTGTTYSLFNGSVPESLLYLKKDYCDVVCTALGTSLGTAHAAHDMTCERIKRGLHKLNLSVGYGGSLLTSAWRKHVDVPLTMAMNAHAPHRVVTSCSLCMLPSLLRHLVAYY